MCARCVAENFVPRRGRAGPSGAKRRAEDALDIDRETLGSLPDKPLDDLEDSGAPAPAPVTPDEVPPAPTEEEEPQEPEEKARRREWEAAKGIAAVAPVRREPLPQKRGRRGRKNRSSIYCGVSKALRGRWEAQVRNKGKLHSLGGYKDEEMAAKAFDMAVIKLRGKDADTNFPPEEYAEEMRSRGASEISAEKFICELRSEAKRKAKEDKRQAQAKRLRAAVNQRPQRAAVEVGPSTSRGAKAVEVDRPGPSKRPRHEGEGEATHAEYYARVADLYHRHKDAAGYENVQLKLES